MDQHAIKAVALLDDRVRSALYTFVCDAPEPVTREQAAAAVGISRKLAAFHLDKLVGAGLLDARIESGGERRVGRTPRTYRRSDTDVRVCLPPRQPQVLADILVGAVLDEQPGEPARQAAVRVAHDRGVALGAAQRGRVRLGRLGPERALSLAETLLREQGFQPLRDHMVVRLRNCPFRQSGARGPDLVCGLNRAYLQGMLEGLASDRVLEAVPARDAGGCCVQVRARRR